MNAPRCLSPGDNLPLSSCFHLILLDHRRCRGWTKDRLGDHRGGSEWERIKILFRRENSAYTPNLQPRIPTRVCQGHVVNTDLLNLGTNHKRSRSESTNQETKDLAVLRTPWRTVRDPGADGLRSPGGRSATHGRTVC
jgi:hypothetical protein